MPRLLLAALLVTLVGCSGGAIDSGAGADTRSKQTAPRGTEATGAATGKARPGDTQKVVVPGPRSPEQLQALIADLSDPDDARRVRAAKELRQWGKEAQPAAGALATAIATSGSDPRQAALEALFAIYPELTADLRAVVNDEDPSLRIAAAKHLAGATPEALKSLSPIFAWRLLGLPGLARIPRVGYGVAGEEYTALVPLLLKVGPDREGFSAIVACANVSPEGGKALWEPAQLTLCELARQGKDFRKEALSALDSSLSSRTSVATIRAVGDIGAEAKGLVPLLQTLAADRDENVRKAAAEALKKIQG